MTNKQKNNKKWMNILNENLTRYTSGKEWGRTRLQPFSFETFFFNLN